MFVWKKHFYFDRPFSHKHNMSPRTEEQFEAIRSTRRYQIIEAALEVFAELSFHQASISQIAQRAKVSKGLIYNYFESKEHLLEAVLLQGMEWLKDSFTPQEGEPEAQEELDLFIRGGFQIMKAESHFYRLYFSVLMQPESYKILQDNYEKMMGYMLEQIVAYFAKKGDPHPTEKAVILTALLDGVGMHYIMAPEQHNLEIYEQIIYDLFK